MDKSKGGRPRRTEDPLRRLSVSISSVARARIEEIAWRRRLSISQAIEQMIIESQMPSIELLGDEGRYE